MILLTAISNTYIINPNKIGTYKHTNDELSSNVNGVDITYNRPIDDKLVFNVNNIDTQIFSSILAGLLFEHHDILVDIKLGDVDYHRGNIWKTYDRFINTFNLPGFNKYDLTIMEYAIREGSYIDGLESFAMEYEDRYDSEDIKKILSKSILQLMESEAIDKNLLKVKKSNKLF